MQKSREKHGFDADEMASISKTYLRCKDRLGHIDPNQLAVSVLRLFRNGVTDEERVFAVLTERMDQCARSSSAPAASKPNERNRPRWNT